MLSKATASDAQAVHAFIQSSPDYSEDVKVMTLDIVKGIIEQCVVYIGDYGVFIADTISNKTCRVHPLWKGKGAKEAMEEFLTKLPYTLVCGFIPAKRQNVLSYFERCGFEKVGTLNNSIELDGEMQDQIIYQRSIPCH